MILNDVGEPVRVAKQESHQGKMAMTAAVSCYANLTSV
jgi:hypothetical protein